MIDIDSVTLVVRDLDRVARFYQDAIGLTPLETNDTAVWLGAGGRKLVHLVHRPQFRPVDPSSAGLYHTAFLLPTRADLGRWLRHAAEQRIDIAGAADHLVSEAVYLADPEGNGIEIYADRPRATWAWDGDQVVMANSRLDIPALMALDPRPWTGAPAATSIGHVHLQVGGVAIAEPFYAAGLGLTVTRRAPQVLFLSSGGYHHHLAVNTWHSAGTGRRDPDRAGLAGVTLRTDDPSSGRMVPTVDPWGIDISFSNGGQS